MANQLFFISDLHLSQNSKALNQAFSQFLAHCLEVKPQQLFILGDLFDYYLGWDVIGEWGQQLAEQIAALTKAGIVTYFLPGNRDFLIDRAFVDAAHLTLLPDPYCLMLADKKIVLSHGDKYCINDKGHQRFRAFSQSAVVKALVRRLPASYRINLAQKVRQKGRSRPLPAAVFEPVEAQIVKELQRFSANIIIHGHTHRPMIRYNHQHNVHYQHIVLPDWQTKAQFLSYNVDNQQFNMHEY